MYFLTSETISILWCLKVEISLPPPYLRMLNDLVDVGVFFVGIPNHPENNIDLWFEPDVKTRFNLFFEWATAYFPHKNVASGNDGDLEFNKFSEKTHSMHELSSEELAELTSVENFGGSDTLLLFIQPDVLKVVIRRAIFNAALAQNFLPNLRVRYMSGGASPGILVWALWELRKSFADPKPMYGPDAEKGRNIKSICHSEGNHFNFWDEPQTALSSYIATINL
jgi:hypothetical protein